MSMIRARRPCLTVVTERDERARRGTVHAGQRSLSHRADDTRCRRARTAVNGSPETVVIDAALAYDRAAMWMPDVSDADRGYLERVVEDCTELLGAGIEVRGIEVDAN